MAEQPSLPLPGADERAQSGRVPLARMVACAERELAVRQSAYPGWVKQGRVTKEVADHEIGTMAAIVATLKLFERFEEPIRQRFRELLGEAGKARIS